MEVAMRHPGPETGEWYETRVLGRPIRIETTGGAWVGWTTGGEPYREATGPSVSQVRAKLLREIEKGAQAKASA